MISTLPMSVPRLITGLYGPVLDLEQRMREEEEVFAEQGPTSAMAS